MPNSRASCNLLLADNPFATATSHKKLITYQLILQRNYIMLYKKSGGYITYPPHRLSRLVFEFLLDQSVHRVIQTD